MDPRIISIGSQESCLPDVQYTYSSCVPGTHFGRSLHEASTTKILDVHCVAFKRFNWHINRLEK